MRLSFFVTAVTVTACVVALPVQADITRLVVEQTSRIGVDGYEQLKGRAFGELDPDHPLNAIITDLELAPRNVSGMVEYVATFTILKPTAMSQASGVLLYVVPNRGRVNLTAGRFFADARRQGHVLVASGWQGDLEPAEDACVKLPAAQWQAGAACSLQAFHKGGDPGRIHVVNT